MYSKWGIRLFVAGVLLAAVPGCAAEGPRVIAVPAQAATIQEAVDEAGPGDLVLVSPGVYRESVTLTGERVVLRGLDREGVVVDGEFKRANGIVVTGGGSVVENLTVRGFLGNGVLFTGVTDAALQAAAGGTGYDPLDTREFPPVRGFRASRVTAYNNALYGIYAFDAREGIIEDSYASGHADSGIYVGQCDPCDTLVHRNLVEHNAVGIEVTNASRNLWILGNRVTENRVGLTVSSNDFEALAPQRSAVIAGNTISGNNDARSPAQADGGFGVGLGIGGGSDNTVTRNLVRDNAAAGIVVADAEGYHATGNDVTGNAVGGNGADVVSAIAGSNALPVVTVASAAHVAVPAGVDFRTLPAPPRQPGMADPGGAPARPATGLPGDVDAGAYPLPSA
ncbi:hypothetical protein Afil01_47710 [Actinorhabdospora filicis]|uniref:Right handed beta helix domain-containing protein n=1 Tax=Actinorhabdospora filicis TaxID=1785913 RepID=A0A9W6SN51_9ACTN|nr:right-handed parallel beta-helix repeat-containing protein [Actinorhabdospora filicis]GLZ79964.1 hypothetical protein Afil01_47710 [Actinorhabdospora filicis]